MSDKRPASARVIAAEALNQFDPKRDFASAILNKLLQKTSEKQRATDIVFGTIRNRAAIDMVVTRFTDCPVGKMQAKVLNIIRIGAYELIYSPATPDYSIVNEAVENAKTLEGKKQVGFVNAALRQITRHITARQNPLSKPSLKRTLPQTSTAGCEFDIDILPDIETAPADYLSAAFSLPKWLIEDWLNEYGIETSRQICFASARRPSIYIRPNTLKIKIEEITEKFRKEDIDFEIIPPDIQQASSIEYRESRMIKIKSPKSVTDLPGFAEGGFIVQDITAARPVRLLKPQSNWKILDLCAAPGTKTAQLAEETGDKAEIIATDIDADRLKMVTENISRLGIKNVTVVRYSGLFKDSQFPVLDSKFDAILLDVPCSNTGVLARRIEARYRITPNAVTDLAKTQAGLLATAASMIKPRGKICYSTCSIQRQENRGLIECFLRENPDFELESEKLVLPTANAAADCDGGYTAIILRKP